MKIRSKLTLLFSLITATILLVFACIIYLTAKESRETEFYNLLKKEAITKANLFLNARVDQTTLQNIYHNNRQILNEVEVAIYEPPFDLLYHDAVDIDIVKENQKMINTIQSQGEIRFYQDKWQVIGLKYIFQEKTYFVTAAALDQYGYDKLDSLFHTILIVFLISIAFIYAAGRYFSKKAFDPVKAMTKQASIISASNLDLRLNYRENKDELSELAQTFNEVLDRLEKSFEAQKHFVSNISHELRTPLAAIIAELEISLNKERSVEDYKNAIKHALSDSKKLTRLSNSLLDLAKASYDPSEITFKSTRIDEVLLDAQQQLLKSYPDYRIKISFDPHFLIDENDNHLSVKGNEYLLKVAMLNLMENGCKFTLEKQSSVFIGFEEGMITLNFSDQGIGIPSDELPHLFTPFYRGTNNEFADGNGIGLSLSKKIIELHHGTIQVESKQGTGTNFKVELPIH